MANQKGMLWVLESDKSLRGDRKSLLTRRDCLQPLNLTNEKVG
jgi:hypothetical protein